EVPGAERRTQRRARARLLAKRRATGRLGTKLAHISVDKPPTPIGGVGDRERNERTRPRGAKVSAVLAVKGGAMAVEPWRVPDRFWRELEPVLPKIERRFRYPGRKRHDDRACLEGILYVLRYGIPWRALPRLAGLPSGQTCWRRLDEWERAGVWPVLMLR